MATSPTKTVKISQTIMLDIDFSNIDSIRIVDVDLLILLKDGQRLIVPEGAVRAMMDNEFSINFKGRLFSVAALMELQTFQAVRVTEVGIASKPALPETSTAPVARDVQRLDLSGDLANESPQQAPTPPEPTPAVPSAVVTADQAPSPPKASTEADAQARETASTLYRQTGPTPSQLATVTPTPGTVERPVSDTASSTSTLPPTDLAALGASTGPVASAVTPGLSSMWKYAVGVLGAGLAALSSRVGTKAVEAVADLVNPIQAAAGDITLTGVLALGPYQEGTRLDVVVRGVDAAGNPIELTSTTVTVGANSRYSLKLDTAYSNYSGPIMLVIRDGDAQNVGDYRDEATGQLVNMGSLTLRAVGNLEAAGETSINVTPLTELAVRVALAGSTDPQRVPSQTSINNANATVAKAFGLGAQQDVTTATVKTVFDNSFDPADAGVGTKYALVLAALSGVDSLQQEGNVAANAEATLSEFAAHFTSTPSTSSVLSQTLIGRLLEGAVVTQPIVQGTAGSTTLNVAALLARQIADPANSAGQTKTLALVTSSVTALGAQGTTVEFLFDKAVAALKASDVVFSDPRYSLTAFKQLDATGTHWAATLLPPADTMDSVTISFNNPNWIGNTWTWGVDLIAPASPESIVLLPATATTPGSDSGVSDTDQISQVKNPTVRIKLGKDTVAGDVVTVRQIDTATDHPILGADGKPRNVVNKVITAKDVGAGTVDITLGDLGADGEYRLVVSQQDAAGNVSSLENRNYLAYTLDTTAPLAPDLSNVTNGAINFGPQTPLGLVNAATKQAGFVLKGSGEAGSILTLAWGNTLLTTRVNQQGEWSLSIDDSKVPADNINSQLTLTQADAAGNVSKAKTYKVEIATAGVTAQVVSIVVSDDNAETAAGAYSGNASGVMTAGMSSDDNTPVVTVKLDRPLFDREVIEVFDGVRNAQSTPLFTLSGDYASIQDKLYAWTFHTSNWPTTKALSAGTHSLTARVVNTYTLDVGADTDTDRAGPSFVVQTLDFNQLLVPTGDGELTNLIQPGKSAGAESIASTPSNTPKLGGTLTAALGTGERLGVYDGEQYLGEATLTPVTDLASPHAYTWEYQITQALKNGTHDLSVRLETSTGTPQVRLAMSQDMTISLPVLSLEGTVDLNGTLVTNDTGWSSSDGYSNNRTPTLTLTLPAGYQVGDRVPLMGTSSAMPPPGTPIEVASYALTPADLDQGFALITTNALGNTGQANRVWRLWATFENTQGGLQVSNTAPVIYELDTTPPDLPEASQMSLKSDTSPGLFITQTGQLNAIKFDDANTRLQYKIVKEGKTLQDWTDTAPGFELDVGASGLNWGDGKYTVTTRLVDKAGNFGSPKTSISALGKEKGIIYFELDTTKPLALATPALQADTTNNLPANASDKVTSNFLLADPTPKMETGATLQYSVAAPGSDVSTLTWYGSYLDAMGAANGLKGDALASWMQWAGSAGTLAQAAAQLKEGVYVVTRRQNDKAGNESPQASLSFKLNTKALPITAALSNDTSFGQKVSSDVTVGVSGVEGTPGTEVVLTYTLTRYADATRTVNKQIGSPIITNVTPSNAYKPPTADGFYTLVVRQINKAGLVSTSTLNFELDTTNPLAPGAITLDASSNSARQAFDGDTAGTTDTTSTSTAPTFSLVLPSGARVGDRLTLFLNGDVTKPWGEVVLMVEHLLSGTAPVPLNPLPTENDDGVTPLDGSYVFKARLFDVAGNASEWSPAFTYTQDTQVSEPTVAELALAGLPPNFINHRDDVTFSGTGEPGSWLTLTWSSTDANGAEVVKTFHTEVNPQGMWTLTVAKSDFPPDTARLGYSSGVTVSQIDPSGNVSGVSAPLMLALNAQAQTITASITAITDLNQSNVASGTPLADNYYAVNPTGVIIVDGQTTDEHRPVLSGTLSAALPAPMTGDGVPLNQVVVKVYDGETYLGNASIDPDNPQAWSYQVPTALADGLHRFRVEVFDPLTLQASAKSNEYTISSNVLTLTANDPNPQHQDNWVITSTNRPTLQGTLKAALANDEIVAVYDQQPAGQFKLLGAVSASDIQRDPDASVYRWSFDMPMAMFGQHHYRVQIEKQTSGPGGFTTTPLLAIDQAVRFDLISISLAPSSDMGRSPSDNISNVKSPTVRVHLSSNVQVNDRVDLTVEDVTQLNLYQVSHTILADEINNGVVSLVIPDLHQLSSALGLQSQDGNFTINAQVAGVPVLNPLFYQLDTASPTYTPAVAIQQRTGQDVTLNTDTGYTSNKTLTSLTQKPQADQSVYEQVQAVSDSGLPASEWMSLSDFNQAFALADGDYTLRTRLVDIAGNVGLAGPDVGLRLDTQAARVLDLAIQSSAATTTALQQDGFLSQTELPGSLEFVLTLNEKVKGLSTSHLQVLVSGEILSPPTLGAVTAWNPDANGYASQWKISVNGLANLTHGQTLQLRVVNGLGVWDQAHNSSDKLEFVAEPLAVDLQASLDVTAVTTLSPTAPRSLMGQTVTINGSALTDGVRISGTSTGIEAGQPVTAILWDDNGQAPVPVKTFSAVAVQADGSWAIDLTQADLTGALVDQVDYRLEMTSRDVTGNPSLAEFTLLSRLTASIDILDVVANNRVENDQDGTVLQFDSSANSDTYINRVDKNLGSLDTGNVSTTGFTVQGISDIGTGRTVSVQLFKDGVSYGYGSGGVVDANGKWSVYFSRGMVNNLSDGTWQLLAQGTDADGNAATLIPRSNPSFTVDTQASLVLNPVGDGQQHVNLTHNGSVLTVSGSFNHIDPGNRLRLSLIDRNAHNSEIWSTQQDIAYPDLNPDNQGNWHYNLDLQVFDGLTFAHDAAPALAEVARLSLVASTVDVAGNKATAIALFEMDRTPPVAPDVGPAVRQIAGETLPNGVATSLQSKVTLQDSTHGVFIAPNASAPPASDIANIIVDVTQADTANDQWRLGTYLWSMTTNMSDTVVTLGSGPSAIDLISGYDATTQRLVMQARSGTFTPTQVQAVLRDLAWVNTSADSVLDQSSREFTISYKDAFGNLSASTPVVFSVDTHPPTQPSGVTIAPIGGVITTNTLNGTNTSMSFEATIAAGEASGGRADFFLANQLVGSDTVIENHDSSVSFSLGTSSNTALLGLIPQGGEVVVVLHDAVGNVVRSSSASNPVLVRDVTRPVITKIFSSTADGPYRAGQAIALSVETDEDIADPHSTLVLTLATGTAAALGLPGIPDRSVTLTRDTHNPRRFNGTYTVQADDTSADLNVIRADWDNGNGAIDPRDTAGNALDLSIAALVTGNTLAGSSDIVIDTTAPTTLNSLTVTTAVAGSAADGTVVLNTLNSTNTALKFSASIGAGEATGGYAEFWVGNTRVGTSSIIGALDTTVTYTTEINGVVTSTPAELQLKISQGGPVVAKLYDAAGNAITAPGPALVHDVAAAAPVVSVSSAALVNGTAFVTSSGFTLQGGGNGVESGATVTVKAGNTVLGSVIALGDGSWSLPIQSQLVVDGLTTMDGITPSTANGTYTLLSAAEVAALGLFSQDFGPANIAPVLDLTKPVYRTTTAAGDQWYLWARVDGGYILSQQNSSALWYWEQYLSTPALLPERVTQSSSWNVSTGSLAVIQAEMAVNNGLSSKKLTQAQAALTNLNAVTLNDLVYTVQQADLAGNVSTPTAVRVRVDTVAPAGLDLSDALAGAQSTLTHQTTSTAVVSGVAWLDTVRAPLNTDIQTIQVVLSGAGLNPSDDTVAFSTTAGATPPVALPLNTSASVAGVSIGGVSVDYAYTDSTQTLRISKHDGQAFTGDEVRSVLHALQLKNANPNAVASAGDRVASFTLIDQAGWSSAVATATLGVFNDTLSLDLDSITTGTQSTLTRYLRVTSDLNSAAGASLVSSAQAPTSNSISELKLSISGAGLDLLNDQLVLSSSLSLSLNTQVSSNAGITVGGVSNLNYSYTPPGVLPATSGTLSLFKQGLTGSDVKDIIDAITLKNLTASPKQGERLIQYAVVAGQESGAVSSVSLTLDTLVPVLDVNAALAGVQTSATKRANASKLAVGESFLAGIQTPSADDIRTVQVVLSALTPDDIAQGSLVLGSELSLGSSATSGTDQTIASVSGMRYSYDSISNTLVLNKGNGQALSGGEVKSLLEGIKLKNTSPALAEGGRVATVTLVDMAGNSSSPVSATLNVDTTAPTTLSTALDSNSLKFYGMLSLGDIMGSSNPHNLAKGETSGAIALPAGFTSTTLLSSLRGMNMEWGGISIAGANTTSSGLYSYYSFDTAPTSGGNFKVSHQSGVDIKGADIKFTDNGVNLTLTSNSTFRYSNPVAQGGSGANDLYSPNTTNPTTNGGHDIGNVRLLYQVNSASPDLTPTINVTYDATRAAVGDRIDLYEGAVLLGSRTLTVADTASGAPVNKTLGVEVLNSLGSGSHSIQARYTDTAGTTVVASDVTVTIAANLAAPSLSDFKVNVHQLVNLSTTAYAMVSDSANVTGLGGGDDHTLTFSGTLAQQSLVSISMGGKIIGFGDFAAGTFSLKAAANVLAPGFYNDLTVTVTDTSSGASKGQTTVVQNQTLGWYWAAAVLGNTNGGNGDDTLILGPTGSSGTGATIQTGLGNDIVQVGGYGATANLTATISDFLLGTDRLAINGQTPSSSVANSANNYYTKYIAAGTGGINSNTGTKVVIDLDGGGGGTATYTLNLPGVVYDANNFNNTTLKTIFGI